MKAIETNDLDGIVNFKPVLLLDKNGLAAHVTKSTPLDNKLGPKHPSPELCNRNFDHAASEPRFVMVRPLFIQDGTNLVCAKIRRWERMGALKCRAEVQACEWYLHRPDIEALPRTSPLRLPDPGDESCRIQIPLTALGDGYKILFWKITVPDVIAAMEEGGCDCCEETRTIRVGILEGGEDRCESFISFGVIYPPTVTMLCPLCVGVGWAEDSIRMDRTNMRNWNPRFDLTAREWRAMMRKRLWELGYPEIAFTRDAQ